MSITTRQSYVVGVVLSLMLLCSPAVSHGQTNDWPMWRRDAQNSGYTPIALRPPLILRTRIKTDPSVFPILLVSGGAICTGQFPGNMSMSTETSLYNSSGKLIWRIPSTLPVYLKGSTLVVTGDDQKGIALRCYNWRTKRMLWSLPLGSLKSKRRRSYAHKANLAMIEARGRFYLTYYKPEGGARIAVVHASSGTLIREVPFQGSWWVGPPCLSGNTLFVGGGARLHAFNANTLKPTWAFYNGGNAFPIKIGSMIAAQGFNHRVHGINVQNRKKIWEYRVWRESYHCLARGSKGEQLLIEGLSFLTALCAIRPSDGKIVWRYKLNTKYAGLAVGAGPFVFCSGSLSNASAKRPDTAAPQYYGFYGFDARSGRLRWKFESPSLGRRTTMAVSNGRLYALNSNGFIYVFTGV